MSTRFWPPLGFGAPKNEGKTTQSRCRPPVGLWASLALATGTAAFALLDARRVRHELREMQVENHLQVDTRRAEMQQALGREKELQSQLRSQAAEQIQQRSTIAAHRTICDAIFNYWERRRARNTLNARRLSKELSERYAAETKSRIGQGILPMQEEHIRARNMTIDPSSSLGYGVGREGYPEGLPPIHIDQEANDRFAAAQARAEAHQRAKISEFKAERGRMIDEISAFADYNTGKRKVEAAKNERDNYPFRFC